jgi:hypothetical protein
MKENFPQFFFFFLLNISKSQNCVSQLIVWYMAYINYLEKNYMTDYDDNYDDDYYYYYYDDDYDDYYCYRSTDDVLFLKKININNI